MVINESLLLSLLFLFIFYIYKSITSTYYNSRWHTKNDELNVNHNNISSLIKNTYQSFSNYQSNNNTQQSNQLSHYSLSQSNIHVQQFTISLNNQLSNSKSSYNVVLRTKNINDTIIQYSLLQSNYYVKDESYLVSYIDYEQHPLIESNPCESFSFPYCILQNYDDSDHIPFAYSIFFQSDYVVYIDIDHLDIPMNNINSTLLDNVLYGLSKDQFDIFTCTTYSDRILNGCIITKQSLIRQVMTSTTISKSSIKVLDYIPLLFKEMNKRLRVRSLYIKSELSPYITIHNHLIPSLFGCNDLTENDTSFTVFVTTYRRPKLYQVFEGFDKQDLQPKQVVMIQNSNILHWNISLFRNRKTKYYHIWCSNWNSKYLGKYLPATIFDTTFNIIVDDDIFIARNDSFYNVVNDIKNNNNIYGRFCHKLSSPNGTKIRGRLCDHVGFMVYVRVKHLKIVFQYKLYTYSYGEDIQLSIVNYLKCNIPSYLYEMKLDTATYDNYRFKNKYGSNIISSYHNITYSKRNYEMRSHSIYDIYKYYIQMGYIPVWKRNLK